MSPQCHRCGAELASGYDLSPFCSQCGAPQLRLSDYSEPLSTGLEASLGTAPPPHPNAIDWRMAILASASVAAVGALLSLAATKVQVLSPISTVWIISASLTTIAAYQRRRPLATMDARIGARIGVLVGVMLAFTLGIAATIGTLIARFRLHTMGQFDSDLTQSLKAQIAQLAATNPISPETLAFLNSPEFRTTMMILGFALLLLILLLLSIFSGAVAGMLRTRRVMPRV